VVWFSGLINHFLFSPLEVFKIKNSKAVFYYSGYQLEHKALVDIFKIKKKYILLFYGSFKIKNSKAVFYYSG
jgi:hypothetical protein